MSSVDLDPFRMRTKQSGTERIGSVRRDRLTRLRPVDDTGESICASNLLGMASNL